MHKHFLIMFKSTKNCRTMSVLLIIVALPSSLLDGLGFFCWKSKIEKCVP